MAHYNNGRPIVFIGHSQGTMMLTRLIAAEVDPNPSLRSQLVSALLIGGNVKVPMGQDVGGDFQNIPACRSATQTGCVVAYSSFDEPPPADSFFGKVGVGPGSGGADRARTSKSCAPTRLLFQAEPARCSWSSARLLSPG